VVIAGVIVTAAGLLVALKPKTFLVTVFMTLAVFALAVKCGEAIAARESVRDLIRAADARGYGSLPIFSVLTIERTSEFYGAGRISYRADGEPVMLDGVGALFVAASDNGGAVLAILPASHADELMQFPGLQCEIIADNGRNVLAVAHTSATP
jgi:hypothetical protein